MKTIYKFLRWLDMQFMTSLQKEWLIKLEDVEGWLRGSYPKDCVTYRGEHTTFTGSHCVGVSREDSNRKTVLFGPDWFGTRKRACEDIAKHIKEKESATNI